MNNFKYATEPTGSNPHDPRNKPSSTGFGNHDEKLRSDIRHHFGPSKQKLVAHEASNLLESSPSKRQKVGRIQPKHPKIMEPGEMYTFRSPQKSASDASETVCSKSTGIDSKSLPDVPLKYSPARRKTNGVVRPTGSAQNKALKNLVVKNLRKTPRADPNKYYDQVWAQLDAALTAVFRNETIPHSKEELYRAVETLCRQDRAPPLYKKLCARCREQASTCLKEPLVKQASILKDTDLLRVVVEAWSSWSDHLVIPH